MGVTRQAVYLAIKKGKLKAYRDLDWFFRVTEEAITEYKQNLFSRDKSKFNEGPLYDTEKGEYSLRKAAEYLGIQYCSLYNHMKHERIKATRKGAAWIFHQSDLDELRELMNSREVKNG
jgi:predicted site-specific integrase-resolvase